MSFPKSRPYGFAGGPGIKTLHFHCSGQRFDPLLGNFCMLLGPAKTDDLGDFTLREALIM